MKNLYWIIAVVLVFVIIGRTYYRQQPYTVLNNKGELQPRNIKLLFDDIYTKFQTVQHIELTDNPGSGDLENGQIVLCSSTTIKKLIFRIGDVLYAVDATALP